MIRLTLSLSFMLLWNHSALAQERPGNPKSETINRTWLFDDKGSYNPALTYEDHTPSAENLLDQEQRPFVPTLVDYLDDGVTLVYSKWQGSDAQDTTGCRGSSLYLAKKGERAKVLNSPQLSCIVNLQVVKKIIYLHTRGEGGDHLFALNTADPQQKLVDAIPETFDGQPSHKAIARRGLALDKLNSQSQTVLNRDSKFVVLINLGPDRIDLGWMMPDGEQYFCLRDAFSLSTSKPLLAEPQILPCAQSTKRTPAALVVTPKEIYILWNGWRRGWGRFEAVDGANSSDLSGDAPINPLNWKKVSGEQKKFVVRNPGSILQFDEGLISFESSRKYTFDVPFVYYFEYVTKDFYRIPFLSDVSQVITWLRRWKNGFLVSYHDSDPDPDSDTEEEKSLVYFISKDKNGKPITDLIK